MKGSSGRTESRVCQAGIYALLLIGALPILLPIYWTVLASLKSRERIAVSPPDWLPLEVRSTMTIRGQEVPVTIFDDAATSQTGVYRVKMKQDAPEKLRLRWSHIEAVTVAECLATLEGLERRVEPLLPPEEAESAHAVPVRVSGTRQHAVLPADSVYTVEQTLTYWLVLGEELMVTTRHADGSQNISWQTIIWDGDGPTIAVAPELYEAGEPGGVRWAGRTLPARLVGPLTPAGYLTIALVCPPGGLLVPEAELRHETRVEQYARIEGLRRPVKPLEHRPDGTILVELLDLPRRALVPRDQLRLRPRTEYYATILGQRRGVELLEPVPTDGSDPEVAVYIPGPIAVATAQVRTTTRVHPQWGNFQGAWREQSFNLYVANTLLIAALVVLGTVLSCGLVGYAFARLEFRGRDVLFVVLLSTMMIPGQVTSIPQFVLFVKLGWIDTYKPLIVPHFLAASAFFVFLFRQFMLTIPTDLEDAARIDGCGPLSTWWLVMMPMSKPIIVTVGVFSFTYVWNDFLAPLLYINSDEKQTVALGLQNFKSAFAGFEPQLLMAASVMMILPTMLLFLLAQKAFMRGVVVSGVKG